MTANSKSGFVLAASLFTLRRHKSDFAVTSPKSEIGWRSEIPHS